MTLFGDVGLHQVMIERLINNLQVSIATVVLIGPTNIVESALLRLRIRDLEMCHMIEWRLRRRPRNYGYRN